jgi:hypothetical protein
VEADVSYDFDDDLRRELGGGVGQLRGKLHAKLFGLLDYAGADVLAQHADGFAHDLGVQLPLGQRLGLEGGPSRWVTRDLTAEDVVEGACRGIALGERLAQVPLLAQRRDQRRVTVLLVVNRTRLNPGRGDDRRGSVARRVALEAKLAFE